MLSITFKPLASSNPLEHSGSQRVWPKDFRPWHKRTLVSRSQSLRVTQGLSLSREVCEEEKLMVNWGCLMTVYYQQEGGPPHHLINTAAVDQSSLF